MEEWFHVKHDWMVELQEIAFRVRCFSPIGCWVLVFHVKREGCWNWGNLFGCVCGILRLRCVWQLERSIEVSRETLIVGIVGKGEVCFLNGYFQLSLRDFVIAIVSRETWWVGGWVVGDGFWVCLPSPISCCEDWCFTWNTQLKDPLQSLATHRGETTLSNNQPANQPTPTCFTWNHSSNTTKTYWTPRNNIRFPNLTPSCLLSANQEFIIHRHNHPHKQLWINSSVSRETLAFS